MKQKIIHKFKNIKKQSYLSKAYKNKYAFVGIGSHSIDNLYPVLNYLNVPLKYIVTKSKKNAEIISNNFEHTQGVSNINQVLQDNEVKGVFICAKPEVHFNLVKKVLEGKKNVFVEKPPCSSLSELQLLIDLESKNNRFVEVGFQKRYAPVYRILKKKLTSPDYYVLKFLTGAYPEGNEVLDLFSHPLDLVAYLFGEAKVTSVQKIDNKVGKCYLVHIKHNNGVVGSLELSTCHSWTQSQEQLTVHTRKGVFKANSIQELSFESKPAVLRGLPIEKVKKFIPSSKILFNQNSFLPVRIHNNIFAAGYYSEIEAFLNLCEKRTKDNLSSLKSLIPTYQIIEDLTKF